MQIRRCLGQRRRKVTIFDRLKLHVHDLLDTPPDNGNKSVSNEILTRKNWESFPLINIFFRRSVERTLPREACH
jgi:hypothetical protein